MRQNLQVGLNGNITSFEGLQYPRSMYPESSGKNSSPIHAAQQCLRSPRNIARTVTRGWCRQHCPIRSDSSGKPHQHPNLTSSALSRLPCGLQSTSAVFGVARQLWLQYTLPLQSIDIAFCVLLEKSRLPQGLPHIHRGTAMSFRDKSHGLPFTIVI